MVEPIDGLRGVMRIKEPKNRSSDRNEDVPLSSGRRRGIASFEIRPEVSLDSLTSEAVRLNRNAKQRRENSVT